MSTLRMLRTFDAIARYGSFALAAEHLSLTQSAISMQMRSLEETFGQQLFDRAGRTVVLNAMGKALLPHAQAMLAQYEAMRMLAAGVEAQTGPVTIGAVESAVSALAQAVAKLKTARPSLEIRIVTARSIELAAQLDAGEIDCAVLVDTPGRRLARVRWTPLYTEPVVALVPASLKSGSVAQLLSNERFLRFDSTQRTGILIDRALRKRRYKVNVFLELSSLEGVAALVRQGVGVTVVPLLRNANWTHDEALRVLSLPGETEFRSVGMLERAEHEKQHITALIAQQLVAAV
ncbi:MULTISPECIES: LysR family transcriptional regulator [unclassified Paraburkholderia]|uniref:LysR family transcriptional regulator n=1 Tax=unclassified Paraburkholderia TaxID=2615204 RepID=UPI002AB6AD89|nr:MULTISPECIES: LysR family transcriptional regulator [unclassified Paraburkholderia]